MTSIIIEIAPHIFIDEQYLKELRKTTDILQIEIDISEDNQNV